MLNQSRGVLVMATVGVALLVVSTTDAQFVNRGAARWYAGAAIAGGAYNTWGGSRGMTAAESYQRGMADIIRSQGQAAEARARAAINAEEARSRYIDNQSKWLEEYNRRKRIGLAEQEQKQQEKRAAINKTRSARASSATNDLPVASQIDPDTGEITWPDVLQADDYAAGREQLAALVRRWVDGADAAALAGEVNAVASELQQTLRTQIRETPATDYIAADRFLKSLQALASSAG